MLDNRGKITMKLMEISAPDFDLAMTLDSGQVFHWQKIGNGFVGAIADYAVYVEQDDDVLKAKMQGGAPARPGSRELAPPSRNQSNIISLSIIRSRPFAPRFRTTRR